MHRRDFVAKTTMGAVALSVATPINEIKWPQDKLLISFIERDFPDKLNEPQGNLRYPYIDPGAAYEGICWDHDAYYSLTGLRPWKHKVARHAEGCLRNFLDFQRDDGSVPYALTPKSEKESHRPADSPKNSCKPLLAQFALLAKDYTGRIQVLEDSYESIARHCAHWEETQQVRFGLFTFRSHRGGGGDDNPAYYCRPFNSSADIYLNSMFVREYEAMAVMAGQLGLGKEQAAWQNKKEQLVKNINTYMWDPIDRIYYNLEVGYQDPGKVNQPVTWAVPIKIKSWASLMPLWAGIPDKERAGILVKEHLLNKTEFWSPFGMRSMAANEPAYEIAVGYNPSCWRGPIWVVNNYMIYRGLMDYGFEDEAAQLASNIKQMLSRDVQANGCLHEYYHPDTGQGLTHPGFLNWNTLATLM